MRCNVNLSWSTASYGHMSASGNRLVAELVAEAPSKMPIDE